MYHFTTQQVINLQRGTRGVLIFGILTSIGANVLHSLARPGASIEPDWKIASGAVLSALAPLVLFACTELVTRIPVQSRWLGGIRLVVTLAVGGFAAWISYWHMKSVAEILGEDGGSEFVYPLIIDGMMLVATISLIELGRLARTVEQITAAAAPVKTEREPLVTESEKQARKRVGYDAMSRTEKAAWTKQYRERAAKRAKATEPVSPGVVDPAVLNADMAAVQ